MPSSRNNTIFEGLWDGAKADLLTRHVQETKENVLVITSASHENTLLSDLEFFSQSPILDFPSWETLPTEEIPPSPDIVGKRLDVLEILTTTKEPTIVVAPLQAVLQKVASKNAMEFLTWKIGDAIAFDTLEELLTSLGYRRTPLTADKGEFTLRGGILDIFPVSSFDPYRIEFFDDAIEQIRTFDPISQKSIEKVSLIRITPAKEEKGEEKTFLTSYFSAPPLIVFDNPVALEDLAVNYPSSTDFATLKQFVSDVKQNPKWFFTKERIEELSEVEKKKELLHFTFFDLSFSATRPGHSYAPLFDFYEVEERRDLIPALSNYPAKVSFIVANDAEKKALQMQRLPSDSTFIKGRLSSGFVKTDEKKTLLSTADLTGRKPVRRAKWRSTYHTPAADFHVLEVGDLVVHFHQGIGKYLGIEKKKNHLGEEAEFLILEYASGSKLFVPAAQAHLVSRYIGSHTEAPTLNTLGSKRWQKTKSAAQTSIVGYAKELLERAAHREVEGGFAFAEDSDDLILFEEDFPFVETEDQKIAISAIKQDMQKTTPMDRLICGDVGYGKTEVAMRAAFKAVADGKKQVAVLVPTTVLAMQHYETFCERMQNFPVRVGVVSRFCKARDVDRTLHETREGKIDILIGTHRLLSSDVAFQNLGLILIDEEQRFGVRAKEKLKLFSIGVDSLTLSATPIPRTLYSSLIGVRSISTINTPPQDRLPIKTIIAEKEEGVIRTALLREFSREGQAYYIHNRVESIFKVADELQRIVPQAKIGVAHGQMKNDAIDSVFHKFKKGEINLLVATTLIENGIDMPYANTIFIERADTYGLADLYQLRGRVGRWNRPAYAYFLTPKNKRLPEIAQKRLHALVEASGYGGGMKIAMRDLEIRGAGDILGTKQSGQISNIGFHLYCKLLKKTIDAIRKKAKPTFLETKIEHTFPASLPEHYIDATSIRLEIYNRLGSALTKEEIDAISDELIDRFGALPKETLWLLALTRLRIRATEKNLSLLKFGKFVLNIEEGKKKTTLPLRPPIKNPEDIEKLLL